MAVSGRFEKIRDIYTLLRFLYRTEKYTSLLTKQLSVNQEGTSRRLARECSIHSIGSKIYMYSIAIFIQNRSDVLNIS